MNRWQWVQLLLVALVAVMTGLGFSSIFPPGEVGWAVLVAALAPVLIAAGCRLAGLRSAGVAAAMSALGFVIASDVVVFSDVSGAFSVATVRAVFDGVVNGWDRMMSTPVPAPATDELLIVAFLVVWVAAALAAELALRVRPPLAPAAALVGGLLTTSVLTSGAAYRERGVLALLLGSLATLTLVRTRRTRRLGVRSGSSDRAATRFVTGGAEVPMPERRRQWLFALPVVGVALVVAPFAADALPGADARPYDPRAGRVPPVVDRELVSPLASLVAQLRQSPPTTLFHVTATEPQDWRTATLDHYDGATWSSTARFVLAGPELPIGDDEVATEQLVQQYTVETLPGPWLPAAARPVSTNLDELAVDESSGTLAVPGVGAVVPRQYLVTSAVPRYRPADLAAARPATPDEQDGVDVALEIPDGFPAEVGALAEDITGSATTDYERLRALQNRLRESGDYVLAANGLPGHTYAHVRAFLVGSDGTPAAPDGPPSASEPSAGTPEQFATAFAVMARFLGYPTRLAVGYRPGTFSDGRFTVTSADAHVWPEVALAGLGWVPFDPTPTGSEQAPADGSLETAQSQADQTPPPPADRPNPESPDRDGVRGDEGSSGGGSWPAIIGVALVAVSFALLLGALVVVGAKWRRRQRRTVGSPRQRVLGAWSEMVDRLLDAGVVLTTGMTPAEVAESTAAGGWPEVAPGIRDLGRLSDLARFSPRGVPDSAAHGAWETAGSVFAQLRSGAGSVDRWRRSLSLRSLRPLPGARPARRRAVTTRARPGPSAGPGPSDAQRVRAR